MAANVPPRRAFDERDDPLPGPAQESSGMALSLIVCLLLALVCGWAWSSYRIRRGSEVAPPDPLMVEAMEKARAAVGEMRKLFAEPDREVMVKYPLETTTNEIR